MTKMTKFTHVLSGAALVAGAFAGSAFAQSGRVVQATSETLSSTTYPQRACDEGHLKDDAISQCRARGFDAVPEQLANSEIKREFRTLSVHDNEDLEYIRQGFATTCKLTGLYRCRTQAEVDREAAEDLARRNQSICFISAKRSGFRGRKTEYEVRTRTRISYGSSLLKGPFRDVEGALSYLNSIAPKLGCEIDRSIR